MSQNYPAKISVYYAMIYIRWVRIVEYNLPHLNNLGVCILTRLGIVQLIKNIIILYRVCISYLLHFFYLIKYVIQFGKNVLCDHEILIQL